MEKQHGVIFLQFKAITKAHYHLAPLPLKSIVGPGLHLWDFQMSCSFSNMANPNLRHSNCITLWQCFSGQLTATMGSTERMSVLPVRTCLAMKSTWVSLRFWDWLEEAWLCWEEELPGCGRARPGLEDWLVSGQAVLWWQGAATVRSSGSNPTTARRFLLHMAKSSLSSWRKVGFRQQ